MLIKQKLKRLLYFSLGFLIFFSLILFLFCSFGIIVSESMMGRVGMIITFLSGSVIIWFLFYYYCYITIYKAEKNEDGVKLYAIMKTYYISGEYSIEESLKNYILVSGRKKLLLPKYHTRPTRKDICFTKEELSTLVNNSLKKEHKKMTGEMSTGLTKREKIWLDKLFETEFKGKEILRQQLTNAKVIDRIYYPYVSLKFLVNKKVKKYPYNVRVPIEMRVFQKSLSPIVFLLHVIDGIVDELEIFTADLSELDVFNVDFHNVEYVVDDDHHNMGKTAAKRIF